MRASLVILLVAVAVAPGAFAHEPTTQAFATALAMLEKADIDAAFDDDAWEGLEDHAVTWESPEDDHESTVEFGWDPVGRDLYAAFTLYDTTDDAGDQLVLAFDPRHEAPDDEDVNEARQDQFVFYRDGSWEVLSIESGAVLDPSPECDDGVDNDGDGDEDFPDDAACADEDDDDEEGADDDNDHTPAHATRYPSPSEFDYAVESLSSRWRVEFTVPWTRNLSGWAVVQTDASEDSTEYPNGANTGEPRSWADVVAVQREAIVTLEISPETARRNDTVTLRATVVPAATGQAVVFQQSLDGGATWTEITTKTQSVSGVASTPFTIPASGSPRVRARLAENDVWAATTSEVLSVGIADDLRVVHADSATFVRYAESAGVRSYILLANATPGRTVTWEASPDGASWERLSTASGDNPLLTTWTPPDKGAWTVRVVSYAAGGAGRALDPIAFPAYGARGGGTPVEMTLTGRVVSGVLDLVANATPAPTGEVTFYRAPSTLVGRAPLVNGQATLALDPPLPGNRTYVAVFNGGSGFEPASARAALATPAAEVAVDLERASDRAGENIVVKTSDTSSRGRATLEVTALAGRVPIPGAAFLVVSPPSGPVVELDLGATSGTASASFLVPVAGTYRVDLRYFRPEGATVVVETRNATFESRERAIALAFDVPPSLVVGGSRLVIVRFLEDNMSADVRSGVVVLEEIADNVTREVGRADAAGAAVDFRWTPSTSGRVVLRATYSGAEGIAATMGEVSLTVRAAEAPPRSGTPGPALITVLCGVALALVLRRR